MWYKIWYKKATGVSKSDFAIKVDLASLKLDIDKLDTAELKTVLNKLKSLKSKVDKLDGDEIKTISTPSYT